MDPLLVSAFVYMLLTGWNWSQATGYRNKKARLEARERDLAAAEARLAAETRMRRLFPPRVYELTRQMLGHAVRAELADLAVISRTEPAGTCQLVVDQCSALAEAILIGRFPSPWPPAEEDLRLVAAIATSGLELSGEKIAGTGPPAAAGDEAVYAYLSRVVAGELAPHVFPPGESVIPPVWVTAAMLVSFLPGRPWQAHPDLIWSLDADDGVNNTALAALRARSHRRHFRPTAADPE